MKAILVDTESPNRDLLWQDAADPVASEGQVLVDIHASAVNRADLLQRGGHYPPPPGESEILGLEMAGVVAAAGPGASDWRGGDRVSVRFSVAEGMPNVSPSTPGSCCRCRMAGASNGPPPYPRSF